MEISKVNSETKNKARSICIRLKTTKKGIIRRERNSSNLICDDIPKSITCKDKKLKGAVNNFLLQLSRRYNWLTDAQKIDRRLMIVSFPILFTHIYLNVQYLYNQNLISQSYINLEKVRFTTKYNSLYNN